MLKEVFSSILKKRQPYISIVAYVLSGIIGLFYIISIKTPFRIELSFFDNVKWNNSESYESLVLGTGIVFLCYIVFYIISRVIMYKGNRKRNVHLKCCVALFTIEDILDLLCSLLSLSFMCSTYIIEYQHISITYSTLSGIVFWVIMIYFGSLIIRYFYVNNQKYYQNNCKE